MLSRYPPPQSGGVSYHHYRYPQSNRHLQLHHHHLCHQHQHQENRFSQHQILCARRNEPRLVAEIVRIALNCQSFNFAKPDGKQAKGSNVNRPSLDGNRAKKIVQFLADEQLESKLNAEHLALLRDTQVVPLARAMGRLYGDRRTFNPGEAEEWRAALTVAIDNFQAATGTRMFLSLHVLAVHVPDFVERLGTTLWEFSQQGVERMAGILRRAYKTAPSSATVPLEYMMQSILLNHCDLMESPP